MANMMKNIRYILVLLAVMVSVSAYSAPRNVESSDSIKRATGWFRYIPYGHSLYADVHPYFPRFDVAYCTNRNEYDWASTGKKMRLNTFGVFGFIIPIWSGNYADNKYGVSVTLPAYANLWLDILEPITAPVVNTDYRIGLPTVTFIHRLNRGFAKNYSIAWSPFKHESTHIGDELQIEYIERGYKLKRVNVSYNYTELDFTFNEAENKYEQNHTFRFGLMVLWKNDGWYNVEPSDGDQTQANENPSLPIEAFLQYQYQSPTSKHGFQGIASIEARNRAKYGYEISTTNSTASHVDSRVFTCNIFVGCRYNTPNYDGYFSRIAFGVRAYHGNCPNGQFRNIENFNQASFCLIFE